MSNLLQFSRSPYLLQHAKNPVHWNEWNDDALREAAQKNKLLIISIGYSACHWCHVMEHESFEDVEVAALMNEYFVNIKVDREERPDIDQVYMNAAMLINGQGGWPLNAIALPDGRPIFAGTYFPKRNWMQLLNYFANVYQKDPQKLIEQAQNVTAGLNKIDYLPKLAKHVQLDAQLLDIQWKNWEHKIDDVHGGRRGAPKFVMPNNYDYLLKYYLYSQNESVKNTILLTLDKVALGGINDLVSGGFTRYSTDERWHIPHFEKMLYDNGQLLSLYAQAWRQFKQPLYLEVLEQTFQWLEREMKAPDGGYFAALDADSEGVEGKYYLFTWDELSVILGENLLPFADYYQCTIHGNWEHGWNHLHSDELLEDYCQRKNIDYSHTKAIFSQCREQLHQARQEKVRPGLDDKRISGWNGLLMSGFVNAFWATNDQKYLNAAITLAEFIETKMSDGPLLWHTYNHGKAYIEGYLSDYAPMIQSYILLYQVTFDEKYLLKSYEWMEYVIDHFYDESSGMFFLTSDQSEKLVSRPMELSDNVISSSNSIMARCLWQLGIYFDKPVLKEISELMLQTVLKDAVQNGAFYAEWSSLLWEQIHPFYEVAFTSEDAPSQLSALMRENYLPQLLAVGSKDLSTSKIPLLKDKVAPNIYVCRNYTCQAPVQRIEDVLQLII